MSYEVKLPRLTQTMSEGTVTRWLKAEGDTVKEREPLLEVVTDKASVDVESPAAGVLGKILVREGDVAVGALVAIILAPGEKLSDLVMPSPAAKLGATERAVQSDSPIPAPRTAATGGKLRASPVAKRLAQERGADLALVAPTGPGGLITETDVRKFLDSQGTAEQTTNADEEIIPLVGVRKIIADRLSLSRRTAADVTTVAEVDMTEVAELRKRLELTYTAFVARAVVRALADFPILNSRLQGDKIVVSKRIHLGVAVAVNDGLVVPVIKDAADKGLRQIGGELAELAKLGAEGKLTPEQLTGSSFTVTNSGVFGSLLFTPIINPPESAILGMGKVTSMPVVRDEQIVIRKMMYLCLTYDHRVVDGAPAVKFLQRVKALLETPNEL